MKMALAYLPNLALESTDTVVQMSMPVLGFALLIAVITGVVAGCAPSWRSARMNQSEYLKQGSRAMGGGGRAPLQSLLVVTEFALALTLLAGAGMALHSFWNLSHIDVGFMAEHVLTAELHPQNNRTNWTGNPAQNLARQEALLEHLRQIPGVLDAALSTGIPMSGADTFPFTVVGQPFDPAHKPVADLEAVSPSFFSTFGVRLVRGRFLNESDTPQSEPVVMVNETFVRRYLPSEDPLNHRLEFPPPAIVRDRTKPPSPTQFQIIGVFHDVLNNQHLTGEVQPQMYICQWVAGRPFAISLRTVVKRSVESEQRFTASGDRGRTRRSYRPRTNHGADVGAGALERPGRDDPVCRVRGGGPAAGQRRHLRRDVVCRGAAHARDWRSHGAGGATERSGATSVEQRNADGNRWALHWTGRRTGIGADDALDALRREVGGRVKPNCRGGLAARGSAVGMLGAGAALGRSGPDAGAQE